MTAKNNTMNSGNSPEDLEARKRRPIWRPIAAAVTGASVLAAAAFGVWASLSATTSNATPETVSSGTLELTMENNGAGFGQNIVDMAPGDTVNRYVTLTNGGTLAAKNLAMKVEADGDSALIDDGAGPVTTKALRVSVQACDEAWVPATNTCGGVSSGLLAPGVVLGTLDSGSGATLISGTLNPGAVQYLRISVQLPDQTETTVDGEQPANSIQGLSADLTYTFSEQQRTATTTNS